MVVFGKECSGTDCNKKCYFKQKFIPLPILMY